MNRDEKAQAVSELHEGIGKATNAFLIDFKGITVPQVTELRKQVRDSKSEYVVVKNTLALIAVKDSPLVALKTQFKGETAVAFNKTDAVALAKALTKFAKDVPTVQFKGAMLNGQIVPATEIQNIANLPSREELISKLLFLMQSPIRGLVTVLAANIRNLAVVLDQIAKAKGGAEPEAAIEEGVVGPQGVARPVELVAREASPGRLHPRRHRRRRGPGGDAELGAPVVVVRQLVEVDPHRRHQGDRPGPVIAPCCAPRARRSERQRYLRCRGDGCSRSQNRRGHSVLSCDWGHEHDAHHRPRHGGFRRRHDRGG